MTTTNATPTPEEPTPSDVARGLADLDAFLAERAPAGRVPAERGQTKRVRRLRGEVSEAHALLELQGDEAPLRVDSPRVRKRRKAMRQAAVLHRLAQDPDARAFQAARVRRVVVGAGMVALTLALAWSTAGVQAFAAEGAPVWSPGWVFAWFVEPFLSLALLTVVGAKAYMAVRGQPIVSPTLDRIEWLFLGLTFGMNAWRHLPGIAETFSLSALVLHVLGPIVAVAIVRALPPILAAFTNLHHDEVNTETTSSETSSETSSGTSSRPFVPGVPPTGSDLHGKNPATTSSRAVRKRARQEVTATVAEPVKPTIKAHRDQLRALVTTGEIDPATASVNAVAKRLGCRWDRARALLAEITTNSHREGEQ